MPLQLVVMLSVSVSPFSTRSFRLAWQAAGEPGMPWWGWALLILLVLVILVAWWLSRSNRSAAYQPPAHSPASQPLSEKPAPDDLAIIEGIGPKIAARLQSAGITTFAQLAETDPARLDMILEEAGLQLADPGTWPAQARLAAAGDWEGLNALKASLKGGRLKQ